jgi:hypothetical protein
VEPEFAARFAGMQTAPLFVLLRGREGMKIRIRIRMRILGGRVGRGD